MSGHSKWSTIKHKKAALDAKRGKLWSKVSRAVTMAAKEGGGNPDDNPRLRMAIDKAKSANMPKDTIEKAVKKGTGELAGESYEDVAYEGYGPGGVAVMAKGVTDNRARTGAEIRKMFERSGGNLGALHCVAFQFQQKGVIIVPVENCSEDKIMELALEAGAEDVSSSEMIHEVTTTPDGFEAVKTAVDKAGIECVSAELSMVAMNTIELDVETARKAMRLIDALDDHDDIDDVYSNIDLSDEVVAQLTKDA